jgi:hypothetical protein
MDLVLYFGRNDIIATKRLFENYLFYPISVLLEEFNPQNTIVFLRLNSSSALNLNKLSNFQTASKWSMAEFRVALGDIDHMVN